MSTSGDRKSRRKALTRADRALCPVSVSAKCGLRVAEVAAAMRAHDIVGPLDSQTVRRWLNGAEPIPDWFVELLTRKAVRSARRHARNEARRADEEYRDLVRSKRVYRLLEAGKRRRFSEPEMVTVHDVAIRAAKDLVRGASADELSAVELSALRAVSVDPSRHTSWPLHAVGCDGTGDSCQ